MEKSPDPVRFRPSPPSNNGVVLFGHLDCFKDHPPPWGGGDCGGKYHSGAVCFICPAPRNRSECLSSIIDRPSLLAYFLWRRNRNKDNPLKPAKTNVVGSGTAVIIISPLGEPPGLATPETSARTIIADESMMEPPPPRPKASWANRSG